ncbi:MULTISPECIES: DUF2730 family protein [Aeromonas]|uniref:Uncharacterized protein DUF2730 n=2 Tax=Aeromonas TaxID=642 RepID=A0AAX1PLW0_AERSA|nr:MULTISPECIES: DUF2730 family protein [Aeromonas]MDM5141721.1 DUF2730 domain-containing protein [Aeromonas bestiarum]RAJ06388.1 uncharacterized protein DUF2730 [Aeromonas salmonicida]
MEFDWIPKWWGVITTGVAVLATVAMLWLSKTFARREELNKVSITMDELTSRVTSLENRVDNLPTQEQFYELGIQLEGLRGDIKALTAQLKPTNHQINLLLEQRLNEK